MKCPYCGSEFEIEALQALVLEQNTESRDNMTWDTAAGSEWTAGEAEGLRIYTCNTCGGEIVADETTGASECPFCGNPVIMTGQFAGALKPDLVIPFQVDKKRAVAALQNHYKGKVLLPKVFKDQNHIREVKGLYVPVWLFDTDADAHVNYRATRIRSWSDSRYNYTETAHFAVVRGGGIGFENVPVDGSTKMDDALMESIEPFDYTQMVDFHTAYLSGFLADKFDVARESGKDRIRQRVSSSMDSLISHTFVGYDSVTPTHKNIHIDHSRGRYVLLPVWLLTIRFAEQTYHFAMNGQTGRITGNLPVSVGRAVAWFCGIALPLAALISVLLML
jgi:DNA-directed RNA polymerase subunit RPC12/RpoP